MTTWIEWVEPVDGSSEAIFMRVKREVAISMAKRVAARSGHTYESDQHALEDFMAVHWANEIPGEMRPDPLRTAPAEERFSYSLDQERYFGDFKTRDDAIAAAADEADCPDGDEFTVWTGRAKPFASNPKWLGGWLIDRLQDEAADECGDVGDDWLAEVDEEALGRAMWAVVLALDPPEFWSVEDVQEHTGQRR